MLREADGCRTLLLKLMHEESTAAPSTIRSDDVGLAISQPKEREMNMTLFSTSTSVQPACTNNVHRPMGGIEGLREIHDDVGRLTVSAFPFVMVKDIALARAATPACYILADHANAYIGETGNLGRRLSDHAADPSKVFAREVYVISGYERAWFDKTAAIYLQYRLTEIAERAGLVEVIKGTNPQVLELPSHRRASLDHFVEHGERLLFDAGCRVFRSNFASQRRTAVEAETAISPDETGPMQIGVIATPPLGSELELAYGDLWARGYPAQDGFVVMAGSEVRSVVNPSANPILRARRAELAAAQALVVIPGLQDRLRLRVAVWFPSAAIAAKVVTGAHVDSSKWVQPRYPQPILIAA
jgi:predicted GIY-YIG superfamily endonuclease